MNDKIIYFDNAATTFPKPQNVISAAHECLCEYCGNAGRGAHYLAMRSSECVYEARDEVASLFAATPENVIFTLNTTYALNMAIKGVMQDGGHMLLSDLEHNSSLRPIAKLSEKKRVNYDIFKAYDFHRALSDKEIISNIISRLRPDTKAVVCIHSSNICSHTNPIGEIGRFCRRHGLIFIVDAAQSAGHIDINMERDCIDILCLPAHKGLYSPQGVGIMILRDNLTLGTLVEGGNGVNSLELGMGMLAPERYEGGTLCTPALAGLAEGIRFIKSIGISTIDRHEKALWRRAFSSLSEISGVTIYDRKNEGGILLFNIDGIHPDIVGRELSALGFCLRSGYHCSPLAHRALGTPEGGALRVGFGIFNTESEVDLLCDSVAQIAKEK